MKKRIIRTTPLDTFTWHKVYTCAGNPCAQSIRWGPNRNPFGIQYKSSWNPFWIYYESIWNPIKRRISFRLHLESMRNPFGIYLEIIMFDFAIHYKFIKIKPQRIQCEPNRNRSRIPRRWLNPQLIGQSPHTWLLRPCQCITWRPRYPRPQCGIPGRMRKRFTMALRHCIP